MQPMTVRNFLGGFIGGMLGILTSAWIDPHVLPLGVLFGFVLGWYHYQVAELIQGAHQKAKFGALNAVELVQDVLGVCGRACGLPPRLVRSLQWFTGDVFVKAIGSMMAAPGRFWRWQAAHPMNRADVVSRLCMAIHVFGYAAAVAYGASFFGVKADGLGGLVLFINAAAVVVYKFPEENPSQAMRHFLREWEIFSRYGSFGFALYMLGVYFRHSLGLALFLAIVLPWSLGLASISLLMFYPITFVVLSARGFYELVTRAGHWMGFSVTLAVTTVCWWFFHASFGDPVTLWSVALCAGVVSGIATDVLHRCAVAFYAGTAVGLWLSTETEAHLLGDGVGYVGLVTTLVGFWFSQNHPARLFRVVCFGLPIAQPVRIIS